MKGGEKNGQEISAEAKTAFENNPGDAISSRDREEVIGVINKNMSYSQRKKKEPKKKETDYDNYSLNFV